MTRKIISVFLVISIVLSVLGVCASAAETEKYGFLTVHFLESNERESISVMSINEDIYVDVSFYEKLGFVTEEYEKFTMIANVDNKSLPEGGLMFLYDSTEVHRVNSALSEIYTAPFETVKNDKGIWIPFEYSLCLLNGSLLKKSDGEVLISAPRPGIFDLFHNIASIGQGYTFDYAKDFGFGEDTQAFLNEATHFVNIFNGLLTFDGASWVSFLSTNSILADLLGDVGYDVKYGETVARMVCTNSSDELNEALDTASTVADFLSPDGAVGEIFTDLRDTNEADLGNLLNQSQKALKNIDKTNDGVSEYNRIYSQLEKSMVKSDFLELGDDIKGFQNKTQNAALGLELFCMVAESVYYLSEFSSSDPYAIEALEVFANNLPNLNGDVSFTTKQAMLQTAEDFKGEASDYAVGRFVKENAGEIASKGLSICASANVALLSWDLINLFIPFISDGISAADKHELSVYAMCIQNEASRIYNEKLTQILASPGNVTEDDLKELSQYAYAYLKLCFVTRNAAVAGLHPLSKNGVEAADSIKEEQQEINTEIAVLLNIAKSSVNKDAFACLGNYENVLSTKNISYNQENKGETAESSKVDINISEDEAIKAFEHMLKYSDGIWGVNAYGKGSIQVSSLTNSDIIKNYIVWHSVPNGIYEAFSPEGINGIKYTNEPNEEDAYSDPKGKYWCSYELDADLVDWILENVFDKEPDRNISDEDFYYADDKVYISNDIGGGPGYVYKITDYQKLSDGSYDIYVEEILDNGSMETTYLNFTATPKQDSEKGIYWQVHSFKQTTKGNSSAASKGNSTQNAKALFEQYLTDNVTICENFPYNGLNSVGGFSRIIKDLDNDGTEELVLFSITYDEEYDTFVLMELYEIVNNEVQLADSVEKIYAGISSGGAWEYDICATLDNNVIKMYKGFCTGGGNNVGTDYLAYKIENNKIVICQEFSSLEMGRYNSFVYEDELTGKRYSSPEEYDSALKAAGFDLDAHNHFGGNNPEFELSEWDYHLATCFGGDHIFTLANTLGPDKYYGFIFDNTGYKENVPGNRLT